MNIQHSFAALDNNTNEALRLAKSFTTTQLSYSENERWNVLQILEHICLTDKIIISIIIGPTEKCHTNNEFIGNEKLKLCLVEKQTTKVKAPVILEPKGYLNDVSTFEKVFLAQRNLLKQQIETGEIAIDNRLRKHPMLGEMTISDWLYFFDSSHSKAFAAGNRINQLKMERFSESIFIFEIRNAT